MRKLNIGSFGAHKQTGVILAKRNFGASGGKGRKSFQDGASRSRAGGERAGGYRRREQQGAEGRRERGYGAERRGFRSGDKSKHNSERPERSFERNDRFGRSERSEPDFRRGERGAHSSGAARGDKNRAERTAFVDRTEHAGRAFKRERTQGDRTAARRAEGHRANGSRTARDGFYAQSSERAVRDRRRNEQGFGSRIRSVKKEKLGRGGTRGAGKSDRAGRERNFTEAERIAHELRPVRQAHTDPELSEAVQANQLAPAARNELKTLEKGNAERVARHLVMAGELIHTDPELAHQHAISAARRAGRIPVARETVAITAYALGDFAMALRELRTYRRLTGRDNLIALMVDCERGLERPERALELARQTRTQHLTVDERIHLAIAVSGARLDLGQAEQALAELEIPELHAQKIFPASPELFRAYAAVLEELQDSSYGKWYALAEKAEQALYEHRTGDSLIVTDALASAEELAARGVDLDPEPAAKSATNAADADTDAVNTDADTDAANTDTADAANTDTADAANTDTAEVEMHAATMDADVPNVPSELADTADADTDADSLDEVAA